MQLTPTQQTAVSAPNISFWLGPAGSGKTIALRERLLALLESSNPAYTIPMHTSHLCITIEAAIITDGYEISASLVEE